MKISNESKVGLLAVVAVALLFIGYNFLKGINVFNKGTSYYAEYPYVSGLKVGDPIEMNGVQVGRVKSMNLKKDKSGNVVVEIGVTEDVDIPADSKAYIRDSGFLGEKYIQLMMGMSTNYIPKKGNIEGEIGTDLGTEIRGELKPVTEKIKILLTSMDTTITVLRSIFTPQVKEDFEKSMTSIKLTLESFNTSAAQLNQLLKRQSGKIEGIISDVSDITGNVNANKANINDVIMNLQELTDTLSAIKWMELVDNIGTATEHLDSIIAAIDSQQGTLGKLVYDKQLYDNLTSATAYLSAILKELQANPKVYIPPLIQIGGKKYEVERDTVKH